MKKIDFTPDQQDAIVARGADLLVSASAGSGKTTVMVMRIASMIANKECEFKDLLVLTFTNASAADMRTKLRKRLASLGVATDELSDATIGTFHQFCSSVIRTYFNVAGVSPDFAIIDEVGATFLKAQVLDEVITRNYEKCAEAVETFCVNRKTDSFQKMLMSISGFLASRDNADEWLSRTAVASYTTDVAMQCILDYYKKAGEYYLAKFNRAEISKHSDECKAVALQMASVGSYNDLHVLVTGLQKFSTLRNCEDEEFKEAREQFKDLLKKMEHFKYPHEFMVGNGIKDHEIIKQVIHIVREFEEAYARIKLSANRLDFNDLEKYTCVVLQDASVAATLRARYKYVFIDEYQDTNPMQERILSAVSGERNIFMVGDVKQSIYGFRGCEATIIANKMTDFDTSLSGKVVCLNENFRSGKNILHFANLGFGKVMRDSTCDIDYNATSKLAGGKELGVVDVTLVNTTKGTAAESQAAIITQKIAQLVADGVLLGDIAILSRSRTHFAMLADTIERAGFSVNVAAEQNACEQFEIALLNNMLFAVSNFYNNVPLVLLLQSFVFNFSPQELAEIKIEGGDEVFYKNLQKCETQKKVASVLQFLDKYRAFAKTHSVVDVLVTFITEFKIIERLLLLQKGKRMVANINAYLNKLRGASYATNVAEFLYLLENELVEIKITPATTNKDAVQIITMHASKGLEFPVVFIFDVGKAFNLNDTKQLMVIDKKCGLCVHTHDAEEFTKTMSIARLGAGFSVRRVLIAEEMRLLYVAVTRAKQQLFIVGGGNIGKMGHGCEDFDILCAKSHLHFLAPVLFDPIRDPSFGFTVVEKEDIEITEKKTGVRVLAGKADEKVVRSLRALFAKPYPFKQERLKNSVSSLLEFKADGQVIGRGEKGAEFGTQYHKQMQHADISQIEDLIPEIKGYKVFREIPFLQTVGDTIVQGVIDLLGVGDRDAIIIDYKTTRASAAKLLEIYKPQMALYKAAVEQALEGKNVRVYIYSMFNRALVRV
jgi:ATP-dependent helicase/nuclease subunit A